MAILFYYTDLISFLCGLMLSFLLCVVFIFVVLRNIPLGIDNLTGPQKIHKGNVPRIGGMSVFLSILIINFFLDSNVSSLLFSLMVASLPVILAGLLEDFTGQISPKSRFLMSVLAGFCFVWSTDYRITDVELEAFKFILTIPFISIFLTALAIASLSNAINMIDGLNGLAGGAVVIMLSAFCFLAIDNDDVTIVTVALAIIFPLIGFLFLNFPHGKIFLGDGGAYFLGFMVAGIAVILPERNSDISPFASLLIISFPFYELVRSMIRRIASNGTKAFEPDDKHLHSLFHAVISQKSSTSNFNTNPVSSILVLTFPMAAAIWTVLFFNDRSLLAIGFFVLIFIYETIAALLVRSLLKGS